MSLNNINNTPFSVSDLIERFNSQLSPRILTESPDSGQNSPHQRIFSYVHTQIIHNEDLLASRIGDYRSLIQRNNTKQKIAFFERLLNSSNANQPAVKPEITQVITVSTRTSVMSETIGKTDKNKNETTPSLKLSPKTVFRKERRQAIRIELAPTHELNNTEEAAFKKLADYYSPKTKEASLAIDEPGKEFIKPYYISDKKNRTNLLIGTQKISREEAVCDLIKMHKERLRQEPFGKKLARSSMLYSEEALQRAMNKLAEDQDVCPGKEKWFDSYYWRRLLENNSHEGFEAARSKYVAGPGNYRFQSFEGMKSGNTFTIARIAVVTDLTCGYFSLKDLNDMHKTKRRAMAVSLRQEIEKREEPLRKLGEDLDALLKRGVSIEDLEYKKKLFEKDLVRMQIGGLEYAISQLENPKAAATERRRVLNDQMLPLVIGQLKNHSEKMQNNSKFTFAHICLLNPTRQAIDPTGWAHYEDNAMMDMVEIFAEFKNKRVIFSYEYTSPFIDSEGNICSPPIKEGIREVVLHPIFFNVSVQDYYKNTGAQKDINKRARKELRELNIERPKEMRSALRKLKQGDSNYDIAIDLAWGFKQKEIPIGVSCASAKDRTGIVCEALCQKALSEELNTYFTQFSSGKRKRYMNKLNDSILSEETGAAAVIRDNTNANIPKTCAPTIPGVSPTTRIKHFAKLAILKENQAGRQRKQMTKQ